MQLTWSKVEKHPYAYIIESHHCLFEGAHIGTISVEHPKKWNRIYLRNDVDFDKVEYIVSLFGCQPITCYSMEKARETASKKLIALAEKFTKAVANTPVPELFNSNPQLA